MTAVQLALCEPTWLDPDPGDGDYGPWCRYPDLWGNGLTGRDLDRMTDVNVIGDLL